MRFLAGIIVGALGVLAYQKKDELKTNAICLKNKTMQKVKSFKNIKTSKKEKA